jgi:tetratricopeptide (TPR) repeat protein
LLQLKDISKLASLVIILLSRFSASAQPTANGQFKIALPEHRGQLSWTAPGYQIIESSAKPKGNEIGIRGLQQSTRMAFLGFLFLVPENAPLTNAKCRDGAMVEEKKNPTLKELTDDRMALVTYAARDQNGQVSHIVRGFVATGDICGDFEMYGNSDVGIENPMVKKIFDSLSLDKDYVPTFQDALLYGQILYQQQAYAAAAPIFETAIQKLGDPSDQSAKTWRRVATDQAGMSYGISGNIDKARAIFSKGIAEDPDYPLYYYNLACADAEEKNLSAARKHLEEAFARRANVLPGEEMPDPQKDDSFVPFRNNKEFWQFLSSLPK